MKILKKLFKFIGWLLLILLVLLVVVRIAAPSVGVKMANSKLPEILRTEASLGNIDLGLFKGYAAVEGIHIAQPEGFATEEGGSLIELKHVSADVDPKSLLSDTLIIEKILVEEFTFRARTDTNGVSNLTQIGPEPKEEPEEEEDEPKGEGKNLWLQDLELANIYIEYYDAGKEKGPLNLALSNLNVRVTNLYVGKGESPAGQPAEIEVRFDIPQPGELEPARFLALVKLAPLGGEGIPDVNAAVRLIGMELATFGPLMVPGAATALGGDAFDVVADIGISPTRLDGLAEIITINGNKLSAPVEGNPAEGYDWGKTVRSLFGSILMRPGQAVAGAVGDAAEAGLAVAAGTAEAGVALAEGAGKTGLAVAEGAADTATAAVKGVGNTVGKFGGGLLKAGGGLLKGDLEAAGEGLKDSTVGTVGAAVGTVVDTGSAAAEGVVDAGNQAVEGVSDAGNEALEGVADAGNKATGGDDDLDWRQQINTRFEAESKAAAEKLEAMPFPISSKKE